MRQSARCMLFYYSNRESYRRLEVVPAHSIFSPPVVLRKTNSCYLLLPCHPAKRMTPFVPEAVKAGGAGLTFAKSKRTYRLTRVEMDLREAKKSLLYASMSDPTVSAEQPDPDSTVNMCTILFSRMQTSSSKKTLQVQIIVPFCDFRRFSKLHSADLGPVAWRRSDNDCIEC